MTSYPPFKPGRHQTIGAQYIVDHDRCMVVADPGLGKTGMGLMAFDILKLCGSNFFPALVLAPKRVADVVWTGERDKWSTFHDMSIIKVMGDKEARVAALRQSIADIYVCNYENSDWLVSQWSQAKWPFKIVFADESQRLKSFRISKGGVRAQALSNIARFTGRWVNFTGTAVPNGLQDLWGQYWFVDFGEALLPNYDAYFEKFFMQNQYTHRVSMQYGAAPAIHEAVKDKMISFRAEDWLDIQQPQIIPVEFNLGTNAMNRYKEMEKDFFMEIDDRQISAGTAMVKSMKLLQVTAGSIYDELSVPHAIHDDRLQTLEDVLEQIVPEPLLVAYWFKFDVPRLMERLKKLRISARVYDGQKDEDDWNAGKFRVLLLQEGSGQGLNLHQPCRDCFFYTYTWNAEFWKQFFERIGPVRQAQAGKKKVARLWFAKAIGTLDAEVVDSNFGKLTVEEALKRARAQRYI
jgi:hypothetical protein